jgi:hypothetical protein
MNKTQAMQKDIMTGLLFLAGLLSFVFGEFIMSTMLFGTASLASNLQTAKSVKI